MSGMSQLAYANRSGLPLRLHQLVRIDFAIPWLSCVFRCRTREMSSDRPPSSHGQAEGYVPADYLVVHLLGQIHCGQPHQLDLTEYTGGIYKLTIPSHVPLVHHSTFFSVFILDIFASICL